MYPCRGTWLKGDQMGSTVCLAMIVRDEQQVIGRCLASVKPYIDRYVICDTGSTDQTVEEIGLALEGVPGLILHHEWRDFAHNRNLAMQAALQSGADYIMIIDADQWLVCDDPHIIDHLEADVLTLEFRDNDVSYPHPVLFSARFPWRWEGVVHEYATCDQVFTPMHLVGAHVLTAHDGGSYADPDKHQKRVDLLEAALKDDPGNHRYWYFLAQEYLSLGNTSRAIAAYEVRASLEGGNPAEIWYSVYKIAWLHMITGRWDDARQDFQDATRMDARRAEAWFWWGCGHYARREYEEALGPFKLAAGLAKPATGHLIENAIYDYAALCNYAIVSAHVGNSDQAHVLARQALALPDLPTEQREGLERLLIET